jgi:magnesium chelatase family protein
MSLAVIKSRAKLGIEAPIVSVEVHLSNGLPAFNIVGLPEASVKESKYYGKPSTRRYSKARKPF